MLHRAFLLFHRIARPEKRTAQRRPAATTTATSDADAGGKVELQGCQATQPARSQCRTPEQGKRPDAKADESPAGRSSAKSHRYRFKGKTRETENELTLLVLLPAMDYGRQNFFRQTYCVFVSADAAVLKDQQPDYVSRSGSRYFFSDEGVFRISNHWGRAAKCKWRLVQSEKTDRKSGSCGFARWEDFHRDNEYEKLYWLDLSGNTVQYRHRDESDYDGSALFTGAEVTRRIRKIREFVKKNGWDASAISKLSEISASR